MSVIVIGEPERRAIQHAIERARERPVPLEEVKRRAADIPQEGALNLADRPANYTPRTASQSVILPGGVRIAISFEEQPDGLTRHLSISTPRPGTVPNQYAVIILLRAFGMGLRPDVATTAWLEEFHPGHYAINIVQLDAACRPEAEL